MTAYTIPAPWTPPARVIQRDWLLALGGLADASVACVVTSPPYWKQRDHKHPEQLGQEPTVRAYVERLVDGFREVRRVLRSDGVLFLNLGDTYVNKALIGVPWRVALALTDDGWILRQEIIWEDTNPLPENVTDRCSNAHEAVFVFTKARRYHWNADAIREPMVTTPEVAARKWKGKRAAVCKGQQEGIYHAGQENAFKGEPNPLGRNARSVWRIPSAKYRGAHFSTFPPALVERCVKAGCPPDGVVLDPFAGSGTVAEVAARLERASISIELLPHHIDLIRARVPYAMVDSTPAT